MKGIKDQSYKIQSPDHTYRPFSTDKFYQDDQLIIIPIEEEETEQKETGRTDAEEFAEEMMENSEEGYLEALDHWIDWHEENDPDE